MSQPLDGLVVWCTRSGRAGERSCRRFHELGAVVVHAPTLRIERVDPPAADRRLVLERAADAVVALTSPTSTTNFVASVGPERPDGSAWPAVAVGDRTAVRARELGLDLVARAPRATAADLAPAILAETSAATVILPGSNLRRAELGEALRAGGREVVDLVVQETVPLLGLPAGLRGRLPEIGLMVAYSPSALEFVPTLELADAERVRRIPVAVMGPTTGRRGVELGLDVVVEPEDPHEDLLLGLIRRWHASQA